MNFPEKDEVPFSQRYQTPRFSEDLSRFCFSIRMFILADKCDISILRKAILLTVFTAATGLIATPAPPMIVHAHTHLPPESSLRKLLAA